MPSWFSWWNWMKDIMIFLGLARKTIKIVFLGLDNAGKTTLFRMLKDNMMIQHTPTLHPDRDEFCLGGLTFLAVDVGGHEQARRLWRDYYWDIDGIVFIIDASDKERFREAKKELDGLLREQMTDKCPVLILGNKIDIPTAASEQQIKEYFNLNALVTGKNNEDLNDKNKTRSIDVFMCSILKKQGYGAGLRWLAEHL
ncbi:GTP-binding protein SAR2-like [Xenia sp. Carnegie-2017]|uniref:GTP-binding protein SAR2-like n=1 Tax=Xenia sp. Carnegie-2017 TaxID=2897299 RepID=UPI001F03BD54|nr:GTP-binding protein SAR2-like [Xenia sp. Carnegie-2017]